MTEQNSPRWLEKLLTFTEGHDCTACKASGQCPLELVIPRVNEVVQYIVLHKVEVAEMLVDGTEFVDRTLEVLERIGPVVDEGEMRTMFLVLLLEGYVRGRQYVEVPDVYKQ